MTRRRDAVWLERRGQKMIPVWAAVARGGPGLTWWYRVDWLALTVAPRVTRTPGWRALRCVPAGQGVQACSQGRSSTFMSADAPVDRSAIAYGASSRLTTRVTISSRGTRPCARWVRASA